MRERLSITIPAGRIDHDLKALIRTAATSAGGATVLEAKGLWYDANATEYKETVLVHHFWYAPNNKDNVLGAVNGIAAYLCAAGEQCVLVESLQYTEAGQHQEVHLLERGRSLTL